MVGVATTVAAGRGYFRTGGGKTYRLAIPYCGQHYADADIDTDFGDLVVKLRSLRMHQAYCRANDVESLGCWPGRAPAHSPAVLSIFRSAS